MGEGRGAFGKDSVPLAFWRPGGVGNEAVDDDEGEGALDDVKGGQLCSAGADVTPWNFRLH